MDVEHGAARQEETRKNPERFMDVVKTCRGWV